MIKKTYGVKGYNEWVANITTGGVKLHVPFAGGHITKYGEVPATFTTSDPVIQHIIENSGYYLNGRITKLGEKEDTPEEEPETVEVHGLYEAAEYLRIHFGIPAAKITSQAKAKSIAHAHNVRFVWI